ncbi:MAG: hypothetical protein MUD02_04605 [Bacteroidales bacterium]|jgi:hypothetical protein|nr:hypothetical protein [Bacteroidales bacterium]
MKRLLPLVFALACLSATLSGQQQGKDYSYDNPEALIRDVYKSVSAKDGQSVDWERLKSMFLEEAVVILRTAPDKLSQFTVDGFISDFQSFYQEPRVKESAGFEERIISMKSMIYKDIAFIATVYSAAITGRNAPPSRGVDFWLLNKKDGKWKISSVINEVIPPGQELPDEPAWKF